MDAIDGTLRTPHMGSDKIRLYFKGTALLKATRCSKRIDPKGISVKIQAVGNSDRKPVYKNNRSATKNGDGANKSGSECYA